MGYSYGGKAHKRNVRFWGVPRKVKPCLLKRLNEGDFMSRKFGMPLTAKAKKGAAFVSAVVALTVGAVGTASAAALTMGDIINDNVDVSSASTLATTIAGSAVTLAGIIAAARIGKRLIRTL